ncbi:MAG: hypothetical protein WC951_13980 [Bacteroidales bacterium]
MKTTIYSLALLALLAACTDEGHKSVAAEHVGAVEQKAKVVEAAAVTKNVNIPLRHTSCPLD